MNDKVDKSLKFLLLCKIFCAWLNFYLGVKPGVFFVFIQPVILSFNSISDFSPQKYSSLSYLLLYVGPYVLSTTFLVLFSADAFLLGHIYHCLARLDPTAILLLCTVVPPFFFARLFSTVERVQSIAHRGGTSAEFVVHLNCHILTAAI